MEISRLEGLQCALVSAISLLLVDSGDQCRTVLINAVSSAAHITEVNTASEFENKDPSKIRWSRGITPSAHTLNGLQKKGLQFPQIFLGISPEILSTSRIWSEKHQ